MKKFWMKLLATGCRIVAMSPWTYKLTPIEYLDLAEVLEGKEVSEAKRANLRAKLA